jgi:hypothetical protein
MALSDTLSRLRKRHAIAYYAPQLNEPGKFHKVKITLTPGHGAQNTDYFNLRAARLLRAEEACEARCGASGGPEQVKSHSAGDAK